jgi:hypothetical protein
MKRWSENLLTTDLTDTTDYGPTDESGSLNEDCTGGTDQGRVRWTGSDKSVKSVKSVVKNPAGPVQSVSSV